MSKRDSATGLRINFDNGFSGTFGSACASEEEAQAAAGELVQELQGK
jgi:hypothetical protein